jgi:hypothetical protein
MVVVLMVNQQHLRGFDAVINVWLLWTNATGVKSSPDDGNVLPMDSTNNLLVLLRYLKMTVLASFLSKNPGAELSGCP